MNSKLASGNLTINQLNDIVEKMGGEENALRYLSGELVLAPVPLQLEVWKTIKLGTPRFKRARDFSRALNDLKIMVSNGANDILYGRRFKVAAKKTEVDLVRVEASKLGLKKPASYKQICAKMTECGMELCPIEVGPQLRRQYLMQPNGERLIVCTKLFGDEELFNVLNNGDELCLQSSDDSPGHIGNGHSCLIFVKPRK